MTLAIYEVALFWQEANSIYALNNEINANVALTNTNSLPLGTQCPAIATAQSILEQKDSMISLVDPKYTTEVVDGIKSEPFSLYKIYSQNSIHGKPQIALWVDCRNPYEEGITTQVEFYHKTVIMRASIPSLDGEGEITIIPDNIFIASPKLNTIRHY